MSSVMLAATLSLGDLHGAVALAVEIERFEDIGEATFELQSGGVNFWAHALGLAAPEWAEDVIGSCSWRVDGTRSWALSRFSDGAPMDQAMDREAFEQLLKSWLAHAQKIFAPGWGEPVWALERSGALETMLEEGWGPGHLGARPWELMQAALERGELGRQALGAPAAHKPWGRL